MRPRKKLSFVMLSGSAIQDALRRDPSEASVRCTPAKSRIATDSSLDSRRNALYGANPLRTCPERSEGVTAGGYFQDKHPCSVNGFFAGFSPSRKIRGKPAQNDKANFAIFVVSTNILNSPDRGASGSSRRFLLQMGVSDRETRIGSAKTARHALC